MDLFQSMKAFVTTVRAGSMSAAASELNITPAMVGQHIAALEFRLGTRILNRTTRRQSLTDFGVSYLEQCKDIIERVALADMEAENQSNEAIGALRITAPVTFGSSLLMSILKRYRDINPHVTLDIVLTDRNIDLIEQGVDIAFRIGKIPDSRLIQRVLMPYKMIVCASSTYLTDHGYPEHPNELPNHDLLLFTPAARATLKFYKSDQLVEVKPKSVISVNSGYALINGAKSGLGIIVQPQILLEPKIRSGELVQILADWSLQERQLSILYYRDQNMTPRLRSFINFVLKELGEENGDLHHS
ncbi:MAG: LysR family transcriptional regulator [Paraglaciecola sp.]|uniref:LysR family transcriptional regulator n=1 Tax=Paraglaciecola sp. TaxID=1920173 RepID=UPI00329A6A15